MPHPLARAACLTVALGLIAGLVAVPGSTLAARPIRVADTWIVTLRRPDGRALPTRRGGLRPSATAIARDRAAATSRTIDGLQDQVGFQASQRYTYAVSGFAARLTAVQLTMLRHDPRVIGLQRAQPVELAGQPDQIIPNGIKRVDAPPGNAPAASDDVSVAVVDTGVGHYQNGAWRHANELDLVGGVDAFANSGVDCALRAPDPTKNPGSYDDTNSHGTHVAGTIGAENNGVGVVGVAPGVKLYSVRVFDGVDGTDATVICGLDWIAAWNANHPDEATDIDVVNMSLRGPAEPSVGPTGCNQPANPDPEEVAVCNVIHSGAAVVVAAGNETDQVANYTPSRYADVITVGAMSDFDGLPGGLAQETCVPPIGTEIDDTFSRYSNFGPEVDINAPGTCVLSTALGSADGTTVMSGTSMATPHVTGAIARYLALHPGTPPATVAQRLIDTATVDWDAASAPDGTTDRLLDVGALTSSSDDIAIWTVPQTVTVPADTTQRTVKVRLQRVGGYPGAVTLSVDEPLPPGVASADFTDPVIPSDGLGKTLTLTLDAQPEDGERQLTIHAQGESGGPSDDIALTLRFDRTAPQIAAPWPRIVFRTGVYSGVAPVRLSWSATDGQGALLRQELQRSRGAGQYGIYSRPRPAAGNADATMERWTSTGWRIKAVDLVGNATTSTPLTTRLAPIQSGKATLSDGWSSKVRASASDRNLITTTRPRSSASVSFTGRAVAVVAPSGPGKGRFRVRIDGLIVATVDQVATLTTARRILFVSNALTPGPHTIKITALGGSVELDAFLVLR